MEHKLILFGLFYALLQASFLGVAKGVAKGVGDGPLSIYLDAGMEMESALSLAKANAEKLTHVENVLARMSAKMEAFEKRMAADITELNQNVVAISSQLTKRTPPISTPRKRPAELACEAIENELRLIGLTEFTRMFAYYFVATGTKNHQCTITLIDKRFFMTSTECLKNSRVNVPGFYMNFPGASIKVKKTHMEHSAYPNGIALIELESDVKYSTKVYPECLYTKPSNPENDLKDLMGKVQIVSTPDCPCKTCVKTTNSNCNWSGEPVFEVMGNVSNNRLFGLNVHYSCKDTYPIIKVFDHLDYIESIVWPERKFSSECKPNSFTNF